jgi:multisubunit Na+/H+ antiporter MnhE subunit
MDRFCIANLLAGAAISAVIANVEHSTVFHLDSRDWARLHAISNLLALFLINLVHSTSLASRVALFPLYKFDLF